MPLTRAPQYRSHTRARVGTAALALVVLLGNVMATGASLAAQDLPQLTTEQRWQRAAMNATGFVVLGIERAKRSGESPAAYGREMGRAAASTWGPNQTPESMARSVRANFLLWPTSEVRVETHSDGSASLTHNQPYRALVAAWASFGVTLEELETFWEAMHQSIAEPHGLVFSQAPVEGGMRMHIRHRATTGRADDEAAIRAQVAAYVSAMNARDAGAAAAVFAPDADIQYVADPPDIGRAGIHQRVATVVASWPANARFAVTVSSIRFLSPDIAIAESSGGLQTTGPAGTRGTMVFHRTGDRWLIAALRVLPAAGGSSGGG